MEYMPQNQEAGNSIFGKVNEMAKYAGNLFVEAVKSVPEVVMSVIAVNINKENPQAVHSAFVHLQKEAGIVTNDAYSRMRDRLLAFRDAPKEENILQ